MDDYVAPTMTCPKDIMVMLTDHKMCRTVDFDEPKAKDNCDPAPKVVCTLYDGTKDVAVSKTYCYPMGKTRVTCTATDASGNKVTCGFWITVMGNGDLVKTVGENTEAIVNKGDKTGKSITSGSEEGLSKATLNLPVRNQLTRREFTIYPNPVGNFVNLDLQQYSGKNVAVQVLNSYGQQVYNTTLKEVSDQVYRFDLKDYPIGMYVIKVTAEGVETIAKKVMKQ